MAAEPVTLSLPTDLLAALHEAVKAGEYASLDEAVGDALRVWHHRHEDHAEDLAWVKAQIRTSLADPDPDLSEDEVDERLRAMLKRAERQADEAA